MHKERRHGTHTNCVEVILLIIDKGVSSHAAATAHGHTLPSLPCLGLCLLPWDNLGMVFRITARTRACTPRGRHPFSAFGSRGAPPPQGPTNTTRSGPVMASRRHHWTFTCETALTPTSRPAHPPTGGNTGRRRVAGKDAKLRRATLSSHVTAHVPTAHLPLAPARAYFAGSSTHASYLQSTRCQAAACATEPMDPRANAQMITRYSNCVDEK